MKRVRLCLVCLLPLISFPQSAVPPLTQGTTVPLLPSSQTGGPLFHGSQVDVLNSRVAGAPASGTVSSPSPSELAGLLANLQAQLEELSVALLLFNSQTALSEAPADLATSAATGPAAAVPPPLVPNSGANISRNISTNTASRLGGNLGASLSVPAGGPPPVFVLPSAAAPASTAINNDSLPLVLAPATHRSLVVIQQQVQQLLPLVAAINQDASFRRIASEAVPAAQANPGQVLTPVGRPTSRPASPGNLRINPPQ